MPSVHLISVRVFFVLQLFLGRWVFIQSLDDSKPDDCIIPVGEFSGLIYDTNVKEPYYGSRCVLHNNSMVQVRKKMCMSRYCCEEPCNCNNPNLLSSFTKCKNNTDPRRLSCFVINIELESSLYGCCSGFEEDQFRVCTSIIRCELNNGGCDQLCKHNETTGKDYCDCYSGYQLRLLNSNGTTKCISDGLIPASSSAATTAVSTTSEVTHDSVVVPGAAPFPIPYIIAIAVALFLLLLLLLLLLILLCCRRRRQEKTVEEKKEVPIDVFVVSSLDKKVPSVDDDVESGKLKIMDDRKVKMSADRGNAEVNRDRAENEYSEDPIAVKSNGGKERNDFNSYEVMNYINEMTKEAGVYEELDQYAIDDPVDGQYTA